MSMSTTTTNIIEPNNIHTSNDSIPTEHKLIDTWSLYHHLPTNGNWALSGYEKISSTINSVEKVISIMNLLNEHMITHSMWFVMKDNITPIWEDPKNVSGGNFSYKVVNKYVFTVWKQLMFMLCGGTLCVNKNNNVFINGITISPKKNFCIIKIWLNKVIHDVSIINNIDNLMNHGSVFKKHDD